MRLLTSPSEGKNGVLVTFIFVYLTAAPGGESGQAAAQRRYIARYTGKLAAREPYTLAVHDAAELVAERHRAGSMVVLGGELQTDITDRLRLSSQLLQRHWGGANMVLPTEPRANPWTLGRKRPASQPTIWGGDMYHRHTSVSPTAQDTMHRRVHRAGER